MASYNKVILVGNLTTDPEVRRLSNGIAVCTLRLAIDESYSNRNGEKVERTVFVDCDVWDKQAETCERFLQKGRSVLVDGRLQMDRWQDKETGKDRTKLKVRAENVRFLGSRTDGGGQGGSGGQGAGSYSGGGYSGGSQDRGGQGMPATPPPPMETGDDEDIPF